MTFNCWLAYGEGWLPFDQCEQCDDLDVLFDCPPEIAWPYQWLCRGCMRQCERLHEWEEMERELATEERV